MKSSLWVSGLILLLFGFCAVEFHGMRKELRVLQEQNAKWSQQIEAGGLGGIGRVARAKAPAQNDSAASIENLGLQMQDFMREIRSRQTGFERRVSDMDDRLNRERDSILGDLKSFLDDMRAERQEFSKEMQRLRADSLGGSQAPGDMASLHETLGKLEEKIQRCNALLEEQNKRADQRHQQDTEGVQIQGQVKGPGSDAMKRY